MSTGQVVPITSFINPFLTAAETLCSQIQHMGLEPNQAQIHHILQAKHPAVAVYDLFESGEATEFWNDQLSKPNVTCVGRAVDDFCRKIYALTQTVMSFYNRTFNREVNSRVAKRDVSSDALNCSNSFIFIRRANYNISTVDYVDISFVVEQKNGKCERLDPAQYSIDVWSGYGPFNQTTCKILQCVKDKLSNLQDLFPCVNAPEINRTYESRSLIMNNIFFKYFTGNRISTSMIAVKNHSYHNSSKWLNYQVLNTIAEVLYQCEQEQIEPTDLPTELPTIVKVVILMSAVSFIPIVAFTMYKLFRKKEGEQQPLITQE